MGNQASGRGYDLGIFKLFYDAGVEIGFEVCSHEHLVLLEFLSVGLSLVETGQFALHHSHAEICGAEPTAHT